MLGEIIEHETEAPSEPIALDPRGFPNLKNLKERRQSRFSKQTKKSEAIKPQEKSSETKGPPTAKSEAQKIHEENLQRLSQMDESEIQKSRDELLSELDPKLIESLMNRTSRRQKKHSDSNHKHTHAEGYGGYIGSIRTKDGLKDLSQLDHDDVNKALNISNSLPFDDPENHTRETKSKKKVTFGGAEEVGGNDDDDKEQSVESEDVKAGDSAAKLIDDENRDAINMLEEGVSKVHFPKPKSTTDELDLNDPNFFEKLHEKYYPDLPIETHKLHWMTDPVPKKAPSMYESLSDLRFDFQGDIIELTEEKVNRDVPSYLGLHHHGEDPHLPGYTLPELAHLCRSVIPGQRCISIRTLGRILHKLGLHKYSVFPDKEDTTEDSEYAKQTSIATKTLENALWDLIEQLRVIESITEASDEKKTSNLSVRNYAIEALWLWKQGGGKRPDDSTETLSEIL
ncbi:Piso0_005667 [Millerozyma farinosa CBS 7064]|uniref:Piso0_005667 protein n=1 Tax=Pichia sorbitophila (strain ATCC MYA-4447 / BCRC 22081 / CBS 7064 / NBRC 10061 / NRRL Y-12695) TaxID=559304 RepID=G8Y2L2_PICSO|nr:Piso0_005667 [Millerozyma farinosa CBS 7064]